MSQTPHSLLKTLSHALSSCCSGAVQVLNQSKWSAAGCFAASSPLRCSRSTCQRVCLLVSWAAAWGEGQKLTLSSWRQGIVLEDGTGWGEDCVSLSASPSQSHLLLYLGWGPVRGVRGASFFLLPLSEALHSVKHSRPTDGGAWLSQKETGVFLVRSCVLIVLPPTAAEQVWGKRVGRKVCVWVWRVCERVREWELSEELNCEKACFVSLRWWRQKGGWTLG